MRQKRRFSHFMFTNEWSVFGYLNSTKLADQFRVGTDDHRVFEKDIGCMTGIHQIFDCHPNLTDQSYGSWCSGTHNGSSYLIN